MAALTLTLAGTLAAPAAGQVTQYSVANGCYALHDADRGRVVPGGERVRLKATTLGSYLLYRPDRTFLAASASGSVAPAAGPSPAADWQVQDTGRPEVFALSPASQPGRVLLRVRFVPARGCAVYPEAALDYTGTPGRGATSYGSVRGFVEGHMHWTAYNYFGGNFTCGSPWHKYGIQFALPDCSSVEGPQGTAAPLQNALNYGNPAQPHDTRGYPQLTSWGSTKNLTYEGMYWRWVQRAWASGMRLMVMGVNENRELCELQESRKYSCDEMETVRRGFKSIRELQRYVDAQAGGPGKGFFQVVTNPNDARRVMNQGRMAVILEIEVSELFGCRNLAAPTCNKASVDRQLDEMHKLGVRSSLLLNKFDNPLAGVRFDSGAFGVVINGGNKKSAGSFWSAETCKGPLTDNEIFNGSPQVNAAISAVFGSAGVGGGVAPTYPPAPHCNTRGLTDLGKYVVKRMMDKGMIVNPDHMSQRAVDDTLDLLETRKYSGVISPHGWMDPGNWPRLWKLGGLAFPGHSKATDYVKEYRQYRPKQTPFMLGWGYGADLGGLSHQPDAGTVKYPFKSYDGKVTFTKPKTGERNWDYTKEGVAQYGLYAEWFDELRRLGGRDYVRDMTNGSEAYLQMWERAEGIRSASCHLPRGRVRGRGLGRLILRRDWTRLLQRAGQPQQRDRVWTYCVRGKRNRTKADFAELTTTGKVELAGSTARGRHAGRIFVGSRASKVRRTSRSIGRGLYVRRAGKKSRFIYYVRRGRVRMVAVATRKLASSKRRLRAAVRRSLRAKASAARRTFVPASKASASLRGTSFAATQDPKLNRKLALLCGLAN